jgi:hypothetical protein
MADDQRYRSYRSAEPYARSARGGRAADSDPLAELARLIGQENGGDAGARGDAGVRRQTARREPAMESPAQGQADWPDRPAMPRGGDTWARAEDRAEAPDPYRARGGEERDAEMEPPRYVDPPLRADEGGRYDEQGYAADSDAYAAAGYDTGYDNGAEAGAVGAYQQQETYYEDEQGAEEDDDEEMYEDLPPERGRGGLFKAVVVLGLAATVTGGAFGYRAMSSGASSPDDPPVIRADTTPSKVAPQGADSQQNKLIYDRVGGDKGPGSPERLVPREEQPVDVNAARSSAPRVVSGFGVAPAAPAGGSPFPASPAAQSSAFPAAPGAPAAAAPAAGGTAPGYEPKRVSTVRIKPDSPFGSDSTGAAAAAPARAATAAPPETTGAAPARPARAGGDKGRPAPEADVDAEIAEPAPAKPSRTRTASAAPIAPAAAEAGGYLVQVSAQNTEEDALRSFKTLQTKYPQVLGNREPIISKVDVPNKGTKYRAQFGPFASSDQATQACNSLKAAGGQCFIQRN